TGEGISVSTLSVETSRSGSSTSTVSPTALSQRVTVPSVTLSPRAGRVTSSPVASAGAAGAACSAGAGAAAGAAPGAGGPSRAGASAAGAGGGSAAPLPLPLP